LFSWIGGLDLGLERAGMRVVWQSEIDPYACRVLAKHWPEVPNHGDIKQIDWRTVEPVDVICGGYPCQPFSLAGRRKGTDDPRHLWPWVRDAISALQPRYAILENVRGHLSMGGTVVIGELAEIGYNAEWRVVSASGMGAPHRRERLFIVAYANSESQPNEPQHARTKRLVANTDRSRREHINQERSPRSTVSQWNEIFKQTHPSGSSGRAREYWLSEPDVGRVADGVPYRVDRLRGLGNAVVPQVAEYVGRLVMEHAND
jgi:DNA (cytosine-5)-methyltransferase 1